MKKLIAILPIILLLSSCAILKSKAPIEQKILMQTNHGDIIVKLYNETPKHRDNFIKLVDTCYYDSLLFHRVIDNFMIQTGDPESRNASRIARLGNGGPGYTIESEIVKGLYHKKGALAAARQSNDVNPERRSSGSQFYIVEGNKWTDSQLDLLQKRRNSYIISDYITRYLKKPENEKMRIHLDSLQRNRNTDKFNEIYLQLTDLIIPQIKSDSVKLFELNDEQKEIYKTNGGSPHLDGEYTIFGEVIKGMNVVEEIALVDKDIRNRPKEDVIILKMRKMTEKEWKKQQKSQK